MPGEDQQQNLPDVAFVAPTGVDADRRRRMIEEAPPGRLEPVDPVQPVDPLAKLAELIKHPPMVPPIGDNASRGMREMFEAVAVEMEAVARDAVAKAESNLQEVLSYASVIRQSGDRLCARIESEAIRMLQMRDGVRTVVEAFREPIVPEGG